jgi:predicted TIM-barrel fold metal-dependent hydrolase
MLSACSRFPAIHSPACVLTLNKALNCFGAERMMWASDASANQTGESWGELLFWLMDNSDLSDSARTHLLGGTARQWLNWQAS